MFGRGGVPPRQVTRPTQSYYIDPKSLLVVEVVSLAMHLVLQGEVEGDVLHPLIREGLGARFIFLLLDVLDHVWEPHRQAVVAAKVFGVRSRSSDFSIAKHSL